MDNRGTCSSFSSRIATFIHITLYDLIVADLLSHWQAGPRAERVLALRLAPGTHLPTPCRNVNGRTVGKEVQKRQAMGGPSHSPTPAIPIREPRATPCSPPFSGRGPLLVNA